MEQADAHHNRHDARALNQALVDQLKQTDYLHAPAVEAAFRAIPRHLFLPEVPLEQAYRDEAITTKLEQGIAISSSSQPAMMAVMLEQLALEPGHRVLEIGAGTGYNAALMAHIVGATGHVVTIDLDDDTVAGAREHLAAAGCQNVRVVCADGAAGYPSAAPYDRIILTVGAWDMPLAWREQLHPLGRLVLPLSFNGPQKCVAFEPENGHWVSVAVADCLFMRLRGAAAEADSLIRLGPTPGLYLGGAEDPVVDADAIYQGLSHSHQDRQSGVCVTRQELFCGLYLWLALHEPDLCRLSAIGGAAPRDLVPYLFGLAGQSCVTFGVLNGTSQCWLMRPPDHVPPPAREADTAGFELYLRRFGPDDTLAERLLAHIRSWEVAGRPSTDGLRIKAYAREADEVSFGQAFTVMNPSTRFVLDWPRRED